MMGRKFIVPKEAKEYTENVKPEDNLDLNEEF